MKIETVTKEFAEGFSQEKRFGVISDGCMGVWGDGDTLDEAIKITKSEMKYQLGAADLSGCWAMEIKPE